MSFSMFDQYSLFFAKWYTLSAPGCAIFSWSFWKILWWLDDVSTICLFSSSDLTNISLSVIINWFLSLNNLLTSWLSWVFLFTFNTVCCLSISFALLMSLSASCISVTSNSFKVTFLICCCSSVMIILMELTERNYVEISSLGSPTLLINLFMSVCDVMLVCLLLQCWSFNVKLN